uniref:Endonuclease/exonuclease/phosphatase domain-containing protein n=1 Tax=Poecilia mexicana TaxID=48701 RepID=A0A3B3Y5N4_9TELE
MASKNIVNNIRFTSWNVEGPNEAAKKRNVMFHIQGLRGDVAFLQETHLRSDGTLRIKRGKFSHLFHSKFSAGARGAAILIQSHVPFEPEKQGRFCCFSSWLLEMH